MKHPKMRNVMIFLVKVMTIDLIFDRTNLRKYEKTGRIKECAFKILPIAIGTASNETIQHTPTDKNLTLKISHLKIPIDENSNRNRSQRKSG